MVRRDPVEGPVVALLRPVEAHVEKDEEILRLVLGALAELYEKARGEPVRWGEIQEQSPGRAVRIRIDETVRRSWQQLERQIRAVIQEGRIPEPRADDRCLRCPRQAVCVPFDASSEKEAQEACVQPPVRTARTLYVDEVGAVVRREGRQLLVTVSTNGQRAERLRLPALLIDQLVLVGPVQITTQALRLLLRTNTDIVYLSRSGRFEGRLAPEFHPHVALRLAQYAAYADPEKSLSLARRFVQAKLHGMATLLRRRRRHHARPLLQQVAGQILEDARRLSRAASIDVVMGIEGVATRRYFSVFEALLRRAKEEWPTFSGRKRRPPTDPVNATLSYVYTLLLSNLVTACAVAGLDPYIGFLHAPRYGRPALALDLMEGFRPAVADALVCQLFRQRRLQPTHFEKRPPGVYLNERGRAIVLRAWQQHRQRRVYHPVLHQKLSWVRYFEAEARLLARSLLDEQVDYEPSLLKP
ncbi:CRISPR-associated endonuclease Cas1 [Rhodothermus profundi]|nr:CRISPR-associated endonuclease Cas1 [Rhodothermus profundi]